ECGIENFQDCYSQLQQNSLFDNLETGKINQEEFVAAIQQMLPQPLEEQKILNAWNAMLLDMPLRRLQLLQQLRTYYDLVLLSNTNIIHEAAFNKIIFDAHQQHIASFFDKIYFSHRVGMRKPDKDIFEKILHENNFNPEHTLFIDDSPQHIETAKNIGIQTRS